MTNADQKPTCTCLINFSISRLSVLTRIGNLKMLLPSLGICNDITLITDTQWNLINTVMVCTIKKWKSHSRSSSKLIIIFFLFLSFLNLKWDCFDHVFRRAVTGCTVSSSPVLGKLITGNNLIKTFIQSVRTRNCRCWLTNERHKLLE